ncbi:conserved hypothetical protein [Candidatus Sulfopaludibacter sp. SbA4]|nr:conserved hypothetical protein [Candidatus Sulfopaludibacter sp. SbA4]
MTVELRRRSPRYRDLTPGQPYVVIGIEGDEFRILNDGGRPYLYPPGAFKVLDAREPGDWVMEYGDDGERYAYPAPLNHPGFFEDFFDDRPKAVKTFWQVVNQRLATAGKVA